MDRFDRFVASDGYSAFFLALALIGAVFGGGWWAGVSALLALYWISQGGLNLYARAAGWIYGHAYSLGRRVAGLV